MHSDSRFAAAVVGIITLGSGLLSGGQTADAATTPRSGNQCKKRDSGKVVGALRCTPRANGSLQWTRVGLDSTAPANNQCDPNYTPCVPIASDVDCAGGTGNGPAYVSGPVTVIGTDIYGLDRDGNGIGCER